MRNLSLNTLLSHFLKSFCVRRCSFVCQPCEPCPPTLAMTLVKLVRFSYTHLWFRNCKFQVARLLHFQMLICNDHFQTPPRRAFFRFLTFHERGRPKRKAYPPASLSSNPQSHHRYL